jgi:hypothetical protein
VQKHPVSAGGALPVPSAAAATRAIIGLKALLAHLHFFTPRFSDATVANQSAFFAMGRVAVITNYVITIAAPLEAVAAPLFAAGAL